MDGCYLIAGATKIMETCLQHNCGEEDEVNRIPLFLTESNGACHGLRESEEKGFSPSSAEGCELDEGPCS